MIDQWLYTHIAVSGDAVLLGSVFRTHAADHLRAGLAVDASGSEPFTIHVHVGAGDHAGTPRIRLSTGPVEVRGSSLHLPVEWAAEEEGAFSAFTGSIGLDTFAAERGELSIFGRYRVPEAGLPIVEVMDATRSTARRLLRALAAELARAVPTGPGPVPSPSHLRVRDVMTSEPVTVREDAPLHTACLLLLHHQVGAVPVVDRSGGVVGVLSESDLLAREAAPRIRSGVAGRHERTRRLAATAGEACTRPARTAPPNMSVREAARRLLDEDVSRLAVVDGDDLIGVLSRHDVLKALARSPLQLQEHVDVALQEQGVHGVHAQVLAGGTVRLTGKVRRRSTLPLVERAIWAVDGVADLRTELEWEDDDTVVRA